MRTKLKSRRKSCLDHLAIYCLKKCCDRNDKRDLFKGHGGKKGKILREKFLFCYSDVINNLNR